MCIHVLGGIDIELHFKGLLFFVEQVHLIVSLKQYMAKKQKAPDNDKHHHNAIQRMSLRIPSLTHQQANKQTNYLSHTHTRHTHVFMYSSHD